MSFSPYKKYTDSGNRWIGDIPSHWVVERFKRVFRERAERSSDGSEVLLSVSAYTGVSPRAELIEEGEHLSRAETLEGYKICYSGDLVMNVMLAWNRGLGFSPYDGIVSPAYSVFELVADCDVSFLDYLVRSDEYILYFKAFSSGVIDSRLRLYPDVFGQLYVGLPPRDEQVAIAAFLNRETRKIDALVAEQEKLIALLKEKRRAVISHAVTKGLDPSVPMKDSGVEWLGEIPAHWEVAPIKRSILRATSGPRGWSEMISDDGPAFFQSQNIGYSMNVALDNATRIAPPLDADAERAKLTGDDVVICITGGRTGAVAHVPLGIEEAYINQHVCLLRPAPNIRGRFLAYCLFSVPCQEQLSYFSYGLKQGLGLDQVKNTLISCPSFDEQKKIVHYLDKQIASIGNLIEQAEAAIDLLKEHRSALISAAVTGKIDVRGLVDVDSAREAPEAA